MHSGDSVSYLVGPSRVITGQLTESPLWLFPFCFRSYNQDEIGHIACNNNRI